VVLGSLESASALTALGDPYFQKVKLGIASARCLIGAFGTSRRLSYTALGDGVNLAARLEPASAQCLPGTREHEGEVQRGEADVGGHGRRQGRQRHRLRDDRGEGDGAGPDEGG
jgi:hypothetical protein